MGLDRPVWIALACPPPPTATPLQRTRSLRAVSASPFLRAVSLPRSRRGGVGISAVSHCYASHLSQSAPLLKGVPLGSHPNPMPELERPKVPGGPANLMGHKAFCKSTVQQSLGLSVDSTAPMFAFVGRWTHEKGIDLLADAVLWLMSAHSTAQAVVVGPIGDESG
eukprot:5821126-Prymnesium_polylepis.1